MKLVQSQFRDAAREALFPDPKPVLPSDAVIPKSLEPSGEESYAQVAPLVVPKACGPRPEGITAPGGRTTERCRDVSIRSPDGSTRRPSPLSLRLSEAQKEILRLKAGAAGISVNHLVLASALGSNYRPPNDPAMTRALLDLNRELTAQGNNLNQIARRVNAGLVSPGQGLAMVSILAKSLQEVHRAIRRALSTGKAGLEE